MIASDPKRHSQIMQAQAAPFDADLQGDETMPVDKKMGDDPMLLEACVEGHVVDAELSRDRHLFNYTDAARLKRKADLILIPLLMMAYLIKCMDQYTTSFLVPMNTDSPRNILTELHMTKNDYSYISTMFTAWTVIAEVPSNLLIHKVTPRVHFVRILGLWSLVQCLTALCKNKAGLYVCRFFIGFFEGGLLPGIYYHIFCWYRPDEIATRLACMNFLVQFGSVFTALISYGIENANGYGGVSSWQFMFIITGGIGIIHAIIMWFFCPDWPDSPQSRRSIYTEAEGRFMVARLPPGAPRSSHAPFDWKACWKEAKTPLFWLYGFAWHLSNASGSGLTFWLPTLVSQLGLANGAKSQLLNIPIAIVYMIAAVSAAQFIDRATWMPKPLFQIIVMTCMIGFNVGFIYCETPGGLYVLIMLSLCCAVGYLLVISPLRMQTLQGSATSAFSLAFMQGFGNLSPLYTAQVFRSQYAPRYVIPFSINAMYAALAIITSSLIWYFQYDVERETRRIAKLRRAKGKNAGEVIDEDVLLDEMPKARR